jgi:hypothetical protein
MALPRLSLHPPHHSPRNPRPPLVYIQRQISYAYNLPDPLTAANLAAGSGSSRGSRRNEFFPPPWRGGAPPSGGFFRGENNPATSVGGGASAISDVITARGPDPSAARSALPHGILSSQHLVPCRALGMQCLSSIRGRSTPIRMLGIASALNGTASRLGHDSFPRGFGTITGCHRRRVGRAVRCGYLRFASTSSTSSTSSPTSLLLDPLWNPTEEHRALREMVRSFVEKEVRSDSCSYYVRAILHLARWSLLLYEQSCGSILVHGNF